MNFFFNFSEDTPESFYSEESHKPHTNCSVCGNEFGGKSYFIEKAFKKSHDGTEHQLVFEYAICERCKTDMMKSISRESMKNIQEFAMSMGGLPAWENAEQKEIDLNYLLSHCIASGKKINELDEYHLVGIFQNDKLVQMPMLYGDSFIEEYAELLSEETKGFFDGFFDHITLLPPSLAKLLEDEKPKRPVLI